MGDPGDVYAPGVAFSVVAVVAVPLLLPQPKPRPEAYKSPGPPKLAIKGYTWVNSGNLKGSFWGCTRLLGSLWERFVQENWGNIRGENPSEVGNETILNTFTLSSPFNDQGIRLSGRGC